MHFSVLKFSGANFCLRNATSEYTSVLGTVSSKLDLGISMILCVPGVFAKLGLPISMFLYFRGLDFLKNVVQS